MIKINFRSGCETRPSPAASSARGWVSASGSGPWRRTRPIPKSPGSSLPSGRP